MPSLLDDLALIKHIYYICVLDCAETVGDGNGGATLRGGVKCGLNGALGGAIE